jgi:hypothetical protein
VATHEQMITAVRLIIAGSLHPDIAHPAWQDFSESERSLTCKLAVYEIDRLRKPAQTKALKLFRTWLTPEQRCELQRSESVKVTGTVGGLYRIYPRAGNTWRIEKHGTRWYGRSRFCYHDPDHLLPNADIALTHLLLLTTDEPYFLIVANEHRHDDQMWNGEYLRQMYRARRERALTERTVCP